MATGDTIHQLRLNSIGVLILVHENMTELVLVFLGDVARRLEELQCLGQKIIKIHGIGFLLALFVDRSERA